MLTITYGVGNSVNKPEDSFRSIGQVLNDTSIQAVLNFDPSQVDPRVNGQLVDTGSSITPNMRIDLVKKAGRKSAETGFMNADQQLRPLPVNNETLRLVQSAAQAALEPIYEAFAQTESVIRKETVKAQREMLKGCKAFTEYVDGIIEAVVTREYLDNDLKIPVNVREELDAIAKAAEEKLHPLRVNLSKQETAAAAWTRAVEADLKMCLTLPEQRSVLAKALKADPLKAWTFDANIK